MWCIGELELPVERVDAGLMYGVNNTADYLQLNPNGTIPTLVDGQGPALWESGAILRYLTNVYGREPFWPDDMLQRTNIDRWAEWAKVSVQMPFNAGIFWKVVRTPASAHDPVQLNTAVRQFESKLKIAEQQLSVHNYLAAPEFTLADIQFGHILHRYYEVDIERGRFDHVRRYYERLCERPQYQAHVMVSFDELRV